jgi:hypothetical protein
MTPEARLRRCVALALERQRGPLESRVLKLWAFNSRRPLV